MRPRGEKRWWWCAVALTLTACTAGRPLTRPAGAAPTEPATTTTLPVAFPLTGVPANGSKLAGQPALSVKIDNAQGSFPQAGLADADLITEELVEGNLTRLFVTYQSHDSALIGPIRSARPVDAELLRMLGGGVFAYSGAAVGEIAPAKDHSGATLIAFDTDPLPFSRLAGREAPHNLFSSTAALYAAGRGAGTAWVPPPPILDHSDAPGAGQPVQHAMVPMSPTVTSVWSWNDALQAFTRQQNGQPTMSVGTGQLARTNVIIASVTVGHTGIYDAHHNEDPRVIVLGQGPAWVLSGGQMRTGTWSHAQLTDPLRLVDASGAPMALRPGTTWIELLPEGREPTFG